SVEGERARQVERAAAVIADHVVGAVDQPLAIARVARAPVAEHAVAEPDRRAGAERAFVTNVGKSADANLAREIRVSGEVVRLAEQEIPPGQRGETIARAAEHAEQVDVGGLRIEGPGDRDINGAGDLERAASLIADLGAVAVNVPIAV